MKGNSVIKKKKVILEVENLTKVFRKFTAVDDVSLKLQEGEILGVLGPNGAGKTTLIQMLLGVLLPTSGKIEYFGQDFWKNRTRILESVNFSSTYTNLPWNLTVRECLKFTSYLYDIKDRMARIGEIVKLFNLKELYNKQISDLSAGQTTRLNLAKAFLNNPKVLLLDEPTASLDPDVAQYVREFLLSERKKFQVSIILTSHNMSEVEEVCDRVIFLNNGKIIAEGTPLELAKTIELAHVTLLVAGNERRFLDYADSLGYKTRQKGSYVTCDVPESQLSVFLSGMMKAGIEFQEISIDKPTLEDYFLQVVKYHTTSDRRE